MVVEPPSINVLQIVPTFFSGSIIDTQTNLSLVLKTWYLHTGVWFPSNCHKTLPTNDFQEEMVVEPPSIIVLQIVLSFFSRSILATQTNLSLILKKWYLHVGVWFPSNCHKTQPTDDFQEEMVVEPPSITIHQIVLSFFSRSILATQTNLSHVLNKWYLHDGVWYASNCHKTQPTKDFQVKVVVVPPSIIVLQILINFISRSILATQTNLRRILKKWYLHVEVWFPSNCHKTQPTDDFQEEMVVEPPSITIHQIVLCFFSRSILATQANLSHVLNKWYLDDAVWFASNCHKTQPTKDFQEEVVVEPPSIIVLQILLNFISRSILATQTNLSLILKKWYLHAGVWFTSVRHKTQPTNDFQIEMGVEPPQLLSSKLYYVSFQDPS